MSKIHGMLWTAKSSQSIQPIAFAPPKTHLIFPKMCGSDSSGNGARPTVRQRMPTTHQLSTIFNARDLIVFAMLSQVFYTFEKKKAVEMSAANLKKRPEIVVTDGFTLNPGDLSWRKLQSLGHVELYDHTLTGEMASRAASASILIVNKTQVDGDLLAQLPLLECICVSASGYNNVDIAAAKSRGIPVCNAVGYGTDSVAQHVFALLLGWQNRVHAYQNSVAAGDWARSRDFCYYLHSSRELAGKTMGIYGFGRIGQKVAVIAQAFGMNVMAFHKHPERDALPGIKFVDLETLFAQSDVISLHAPLSPENEGIVNKNLLGLMKPDALLINTGRGGLINEADLREALLQKSIGGAALDVLAKEPPPENHPLFGLDNCLITPHIAWASREARERLMEITVDNVRAFLAGTPQNVVNA